jgi:hypothetical protein
MKTYATDTAQAQRQRAEYDRVSRELFGELPTVTVKINRLTSATFQARHGETYAELDTIARAWVTDRFEVGTADAQRARKTSTHSVEILESVEVNRYAQAQAEIDEYDR